VSYNVGNGKIIAEEQVFETEGSKEYQTACRKPSLASAFDQQRMARADGGNSADKRVRRANKRQQ